MYYIVFYILISLILHTNSDTIEVKVKQGTVVGTREATVFDRRLYYAFYAVPYARPPVGRRRFKDPEPSKKWKYPYDASLEYHGACAQSHIVHKQSLYGVEDCLHMNIYTPHLPTQGKNFSTAVIVWIHGHAFTSSFSHIYGPDFLIENDVLVISVTHRLGAFGFLKLNETDTNANMGLKDIVMALKWIKRNVKQFGGDKTKITVMGSGSAGSFVSLLLMTKFRKLFSKMILQSGGMFSPSIFQSDNDLETTRLREQLKKFVPDDLMRASAKDIIKASQSIYSSKDIINLQKPLVPFSPVIEEKSNTSVITRKPDEFFKNIEDMNSRIPIMIGFNSQESISEVVPFLHNPHYLKSFTSFFKFMVPFTNGCKYNFASKTYKEIADKIKHKYFSDETSDKSVENLLKYATDLRKYPIYRFIKTHLKAKNSRLFVYKFNYVGTFNAVKATSTAGVKIKVKGAAHGDEICYLLKCEPLWENYVKVANDTNNADRLFMKKLSRMWANFAKAGDPTPLSDKDDLTWLPMTLKDSHILHIGMINKLTSPTAEEKMYAFWNEIYNDYYSVTHCKDESKHDEL